MNKTNFYRRSLREHMLDILDNDFKTTILNILKELKENMDQELKELKLFMNKLEY